MPLGVEYFSPLLVSADRADLRDIAVHRTGRLYTPFFHVMSRRNAAYADGVLHSAYLTYRRHRAVVRAGGVVVEYILAEFVRAGHLAHRAVALVAHLVSARCRQSHRTADRTLLSPAAGRRAYVPLMPLSPDNVGDIAVAAVGAGILRITVLCAGRSDELCDVSVSCCRRFGFDVVKVASLPCTRYDSVTACSTRRLYHLLYKVVAESRDCHFFRRVAPVDGTGMTFKSRLRTGGSSYFRYRPLMSRCRGQVDIYFISAP